MSNLSKRVNTNDMADSLEKLHLSETNNKRLPETNTVEVDELTKSKPIINEGIQVYTVNHQQNHYPNYMIRLI